MSGSTSTALPSRESAARRILGLVLGQRRRFVVDWQYQVRVAATATGLAAAAFLTFLGAVWLETRKLQRVIAEDPGLAAALGDSWPLGSLLLVGFGLVLGVGVFLIVILETHRIAGASVSLEKSARLLADGRYGQPVRLRARDRLTSLASEMERLRDALALRAVADADAIEAVADQVASGAFGDDPADTASEIRALASTLRARIDV